MDHLNSIGSPSDQHLRKSDTYRCGADLIFEHRHPVGGAKVMTAK